MLEKILRSAVAALALPIALVVGLFLAEIFIGDFDWSNVDLFIFAAIGFYLVTFISLLLKK